VPAACVGKSFLDFCNQQCISSDRHFTLRVNNELSSTRRTNCCRQLRAVCLVRITHNHRQLSGGSSLHPSFPTHVVTVTSFLSQYKRPLIYPSIPSPYSSHTTTNATYAREGCP